MYRLICQKPAHFLSAQMFIVLGMYNFDTSLNCVQLDVGTEEPSTVA